MNNIFNNVEDDYKLDLQDNHKTVGFYIKWIIDIKDYKSQRILKNLNSYFNKLDHIFNENDIIYDFNFNDTVEFKQLFYGSDTQPVMIKDHNIDLNTFLI